MNFITSLAIHSGNPELQDRAQIFELSDRIAISIADGAGGTSGGAASAEKFQEIIQGSLASLSDPNDCELLLQKTDHEIASSPQAGETTGIIAIVLRDEVFGASVGDSQMWAFYEDRPVELTSMQIRKPLLGSGSVLPRRFHHTRPFSTLVAATDGLWKYTALNLIIR